MDGDHSVINPARDRQFWSQRWRWIVMLSALIAVVAGFLWLNPKGDAARPAAGKPVSSLAVERGPVARGLTSNRDPVEQMLTAIVRASGVTEELPVERLHSHPIDEERQRIYRENNLSAAMMGAMNVGDYVGLRALIDEYRLDYPADEHRLQVGYSMIADCLERLTPERQANARTFWQTNRGSLVRRFIRRHCLEKPVVAD